MSRSMAFSRSFFGMMVVSLALLLSVFFVPNLAQAENIFESDDVCLNRWLSNIGSAVRCDREQYAAREQTRTLFNRYGAASKEGGAIYSCVRTWSGGYGALSERVVDWQLTLQCAREQIASIEAGEPIQRASAPGIYPLSENLLSGIDTYCAQSWREALNKRSECIVKQQSAAADVLALESRLPNGSPQHDMLLACISDWEWGFLVVDWARVEDCTTKKVAFVAPVALTKIKTMPPSAQTRDPITGNQKMMSRIIYGDKVVIPYTQTPKNLTTP